MQEHHKATPRYKIIETNPIIRFNQAEIRKQERRDLIKSMAFGAACLLLVAATMYAIHYLQGGK